MEYNIEDDDLPQEPPRKPLGRPKGSTSKRMTTAERKAFINESARRILDTHMSYKEYVSMCVVEKKMSRSQANEYWLAAWNAVRNKFELEKDKLILKHTQRYWDIYSQAIELRDLTNARQALNDLAKLQGLNEPDKVEVRGTSIKLNFGTPDVE